MSESTVIYICMRRTLDWQNKAAVDAGVIAGFRPKLETWNLTFNIPYHEFRQRLKSIAQLNWDRVENASCITYNEAPPGALLVPVDDDDWFSPDLANNLREAFNPSIVCYRWIRHILEPERHRRSIKGRIKELLTGKVIFATNNYGIRNFPQLAAFVASHMQASRHFQDNPGAVKYLPVALSIHNRSLASQTVLRMRQPTISRDELIESFGRYRMLYARTRLSRALGWAAPYVAMMSELMNALKPR
jgi:hypothetical protein